MTITAGPGIHGAWLRAAWEDDYLRTLFVAVFALSLTGCARQSASADRAHPDPIAVRVATPKHVRIPAEVVVSGTVETPSAPTSVGFLVSGKVTICHHSGIFPPQAEATLCKPRESSTSISHPPNNLQKIPPFSPPPLFTMEPDRRLNGSY